MRNFSMDDVENFDPNQGIFNESATDKANRGIWNEAEGGERVNFSITMKNKSATLINIELFNAERSVFKMANNALYSKNITAQQYKPHSQLRTLYEIGQLSASAAGGAALGFTADPTAFMTEDGVGIFTSDRTYANLVTTLTNIIGNGYDTAGVAGTTMPDAFIVCNELPYAALLEDLASGLVLDINQMRIQASDPTNAFVQVINLKRFQSFGGSQDNPVPFSVGRDPKNNLTDTIDILKSFLIDKKTGLEFKIPANCQLAITFFAIAYRSNAIKW